MNDNNMSTIDKKIKTKYSSALNYINTLSDKKITIPTSSSIKNHKIEKLRSEMLSSIINNIHSSRYKTNANKKVSNGNHNRNNSINMSEKTKNYFTKNWHKFAKNNSIISNLCNSEIMNEKAKQKIEQIISIFNPHIKKNYYEWSKRE